MKTYNFTIPEEHAAIIFKAIATSQTLAMWQGMPVLENLTKQRHAQDTAIVDPNEENDE